MDIVQTVALLSFAANGSSDIIATETELQAYLTAYLLGGKDPLGGHFDGFFPVMNPHLAGGDWAVVWGPVVYSVEPARKYSAANALYVAYSASLSTYVVAIAGTNPQSFYDWVQEDGDVSPVYMAAWPFAVPFTVSWHLPWVFIIPPGVSAATAQGVSDLLTKMQDPTKGALRDFLTHSASSTATLIFGGHSLAGALAPTLALYLYPKPQASGWGQIDVLPLAGASPGNQRFADAFTAAYPPTPVPNVSAAYGHWNIDYANQHDVVPHAWNQLSKVISNADAAGNFPSIYGVFGPDLGTSVTAAIVAAEALAYGGDYMNLTQLMFSPNWGYWDWVQNPNGSWQYPPAWKPLPVSSDASPVTGLDAFGGLVLAAHIDQYFNFFGIVPAPRMPLDLPSQAAHAKKREMMLAAAKVSM